jgi:mannan endo-1,4-beta-mannosidase
VIYLPEKLFLRSKIPRFLSLTLLLVISISATTWGADFIRADKMRFMRGDKPYYFCGANFWYGCYLGASEGGTKRLVKELDQMKSLA